MNKLKTTDVMGYSVLSDKASYFFKYLHLLLNDQLESKKNFWFACINAHSYAIAKKDKLFSDSLKSSDCIIPDGSGILLASKISSKKIHERITGMDVFLAVNKIAEKSKKNIFLLGSTNENLEKVISRLKDEYPRINIVGYHSPPFKDHLSIEDNQLIVNKINSSKADILWVAMTAPKQEKWINENINALNLLLAGPIGAVFDYYAGNISRSNFSLINDRFEFILRFIQDPRRMYKRVFISIPTLLIDIIVSKFKKNKVHSNDKII